MASRYEVEVTLTSAKDLKNISWRYGPIRPYAVVWVDPQRKVSTRADEEGDTSPYWNQTLVIPLDRPIEDSTLHIDIVHAKSPDEDIKPLIGSAKLPLRSVVDEAGLGSKIPRTLKLTRPSGRPHGKIEVEVTVRDTRYRAPDPYNAAPYGVRGGDYSAPPPSGYPYGAPPPSGYSYGGAPPSGYAYGAAPPQPAGYAYGAAPPQPAGYAYGAAPSQPAGYAYGGAPAAGGYEYGQSGQGNYGYEQEEKKKSKFGGMGTGLAVGAVAGALGGLALAEGFDKLEDHIADEAAEKVEDDLADDGDFDGGDDDGGW